MEGVERTRWTIAGKYASHIKVEEVMWAVVRMRDLQKWTEFGTYKVPPSCMRAPQREQ
ncbi:predicted protein [Sclerotinia sclerotiorum 1980 UF-70]|uniref:Uncharacterized protein n=1 Tax=Sclerotinia sclerotiorum (strain ATCC 18683 / 1980 / Ss-1) TaxID=665079 RepID=A7ES56_SCLS1|nr:predicted protein [Sclerotinia sclerotiorum 1980 UF-70]EDN92298.1 predicted protein [Sclerotinia sclerotiorum 1980 UF-70]